MAGLRRTLGNQDAPLMGAAVAASVISAAAAAGLGSLVDTRAVAMSMLIAGLLGFIVSVVPLFLALRLVVLIGLLTVGSALVAITVRDSPVAAGLVMAGLAFAGAIWTALPVVGVFFSTLPVLIFVLVVAKSQEIAGDAPLATVAVAGLLGLVPPAVIALLGSVRDPRKPDRQLAAAIWNPQTPSAQRGLFARILILNGAPSPLLYVAANGFVAHLSQSWLAQRQATQPSGAEDEAALEQARTSHGAIAASLLPPGPVFPRDVVLDTEAVDTRLAVESTSPQGSAWRIWRAAAQRTVEILGGDLPTRLTLRPSWLLLMALLGTLLRPDVAVFRYGVQRALVLGIGVGILVANADNQNAFWVVITLVAVLQANAAATWARFIQRTAGTFVGVLAALALSLVVPQAILVPWVAVFALVAGTAWMQRNYAITALASGFGVVLIYGAPNDDVLAFAGLRAIDVVLGAVIAAVVARVVLPVRPRLPVRRAKVVAALESLSAALKERIVTPDKVDVHALAARQAGVTTAVTNLETDLALTAQEATVAAYQDDLAALKGLDAALFVLAVTEVDLATKGGLGDLPMAELLEWIDNSLAERAASPPVASTP